MEATVTIICGTILALGQAWIQYRLKQQDNMRDAARAEMATTAVKLRSEAEKVADEVSTKVEEKATATNNKLEEIHLLVNSRLSEALARIEHLEEEKRNGNDKV